MLKQTDWARTPVYFQYERNGRWKHEDCEIYSEVELKYLLSALEHMQAHISADDFIKREGVAIVNKHANKTFYTLEILMTQVNMIYFFTRLK